MQILLILSIGLYLFMAVQFFKSWLHFFQQDTSLDANWAYLSKVILVVATIFWPVVVPIAYLELLKKVQHTQSEEQDSSLIDPRSTQDCEVSSDDVSFLEVSQVKN